MNHCETSGCILVEQFGPWRQRGATQRTRLLHSKFSQLRHACSMKRVRALQSSGCSISKPLKTDAAFCTRITRPRCDMLANIQCTLLWHSISFGDAVLPVASLPVSPLAVLGAFALPSVAKQLPQALLSADAPFLYLLSAMLENARAAADKLITLVVWRSEGSTAYNLKVTLRLALSSNKFRCPRDARLRSNVFAAEK